MTATLAVVDATTDPAPDWPKPTERLTLTASDYGWLASHAEDLLPEGSEDVAEGGDQIALDLNIYQLRRLASNEVSGGPKGLMPETWRKVAEAGKRLRERLVALWASRSNEDGSPRPYIADIAKAVKCGKCDKMMVWGVTEAGRPNPYTLDVRGEPIIVIQPRKDKPTIVGPLSHFKDCPAAASFGKGRQQ